MTETKRSNKGNKSYYRQYLKKIKYLFLRFFPLLKKFYNNRMKLSKWERSDQPLIEARETPLLRITFKALLTVLEVFREVLFLLRGILGVTVIEGISSQRTSSATGDGV